MDLTTSCICGCREWKVPRLFVSLFARTQTRPASLSNAHTVLPLCFSLKHSTTCLPLPRQPPCSPSQPSQLPSLPLPVVYARCARPPPPVCLHIYTYLYCQQGFHRKALDVANKIGISNSLLRVIERREGGDKLLIYGGMCGILLFIWVVWRYALS